MATTPPTSPIAHPLLGVTLLDSNVCFCRNLACSVWVFCHSDYKSHPVERNHCKRIMLHMSMMLSRGYTAHGAAVIADPVKLYFTSSLLHAYLMVVLLSALFGLAAGGLVSLWVAIIKCFLSL